MLRRSLFALTALLVCLPLAAQDMSLDEVLAKHYEAIGGTEAWENVGSARMTGTMNMGPGGEAGFTMTFKRPNRARLEFMIQGMTGVQAYDGETAWMHLPFLGQSDPEIMADDQAKGMIEQADLEGPLVGWKEKGHQLSLVGLEDVEGTEAYRIDIELANGDTRRFFLDSEYFVTIRQEGATMQMGSPVEFEVILSDYKEVDGLMLPHSIDNRQKGAPSGQVITVSEVLINLDVDEGIFTMPAPTPVDG